MNSAAATFSVIGGVALVVTTVLSIMFTLIVPRAHVGILYRMVDTPVHGFFETIAKRLPYEARDRILAVEAAVMIINSLLGWLGMFTVGYALILWPLDRSFVLSMREAASSIFTLGYAFRSNSPPTAVDFLAGASGMITIALMIGYLPTLYSAFSRRETEVTLLGARAGAPPWGVEILVRAARFSTIAGLPAFYESWERWSADVSESHSNYPFLMRFRSPAAHSSWLVGLLAVLDSAALYNAVAPDTCPLQTRMCLRMGFLCFQQLARTVGISVEDDPMPDAPIQLPFDDFAEGYARIADAGFPVERSLEDAWRHFRGWRVNYEAAAYGLAWDIDAVPAVWAGPRRRDGEPVAPVRPVNRTPDAPGGWDIQRGRAVGAEEPQ